MNPRIVDIRYIDGYKLELIFSDGTAGILDWESRLRRAKSGGVFEPLKNPEYFSQVELWEGTIRWPNGADACPDVLYDEVIAKITMHSEDRASLAKVA